MTESNYDGSSNKGSCGFASIVDIEESLFDEYGMIADPDVISQRTHLLTSLQWATMKPGLCDLNDGSTNSDIICSSDGKYCWKNLTSTYLCVCSNDQYFTSFSSDVCQGCCLETQFPLLVYEFIPNGTLSQLIHEHNEEFPLTWEMRLRIGTEVANALSYLHSAASVPIYHRDIKATNILLDDKHRAKVSDFGTSRSVALEQTHLTTRVQGTFGYLDPEYFRSNQFTDKSDVYSFGVVLVELLTGKKPIHSTQSEDEEARSLVTFFLHAMKENSLFDILDPCVTNDGPEEEIIAVAKLAKRCLKVES
ncbi:hypothetical protein COLO4_08681 [Corchorus olitorius]|uniref:Protein kinase domain-containing protein n=1 Tax=Corchorus olitorius TaxID=93759 RepID=A0A1R3KET9_9ROSI|nr:hypothetical protein COLO4_08681 [Corchorus olitorius]